jgi:hypothetical protein
MLKFVYRVQTVDYGDLTTEFMNTECLQDGESLVAIVPFGDDAKIITMKRVFEDAPEVNPAELTDDGVATGAPFN